MSLIKTPDETDFHDIKCYGRVDDILASAADSIANASGNPTLCDTVQEKTLKDDCRIVFAIQRRDNSLCESIEDSNTKALCSTIVQKDKAACERIPQGEYRIRCNAVVENDPSICDQNKNLESKSNCLRNYVEIQLNYYD